MSFEAEIPTHLNQTQPGTPRETVGCLAYTSLALSPPLQPRIAIYTHPHFICRRAQPTNRRHPGKDQGGKPGRRTGRVRFFLSLAAFCFFAPTPKYGPNSLNEPRNLFMDISSDEMTRIIWQMWACFGPTRSRWVHDADLDNLSFFNAATHHLPLRMSRSQDQGQACLPLPRPSDQILRLGNRGARQGKNRNPKRENPLHATFTGNARAPRVVSAPNIPPRFFVFVSRTRKMAETIGDGIVRWSLKGTEGWTRSLERKSDRGPALAWNSPASDPRTSNLDLSFRRSFLPWCRCFRVVVARSGSDESGDLRSDIPIVLTFLESPSPYFLVVVATIHGICFFRPTTRSPSMLLRVGRRPD